MKDEGEIPENSGASSPSPAIAGGLTLGASLAAGLVYVALVPVTDPLAGRALAIILGVGVIGGFAALRVPAPHGERLGLRGLDARGLLGVALLVPVALLSSELDNWARALLGGPAVFGETGLEPRSAILWLEMLVVLVGIEPVVEEWFFRGILQQGSRERLGERGSVLWCAFLFAAYAVLGRSADAADAVAIGAQSFVLGVAFGYVRTATGSLFAPVLLHSAINTLAIVGGAWLPVAGFTAPGAHTDPLLLVGAAICCVLAVKQLNTLERAVTKKPSDQEGDDD